MFRNLFGALAASAVLICCAPANAAVVYNITFKNSAGTVVEGTGVLTLNLATLAQANNLVSNSISTFTSLTTTVIDNQTAFNLLPADLTQFSINTGNVGQVFGLTVAQTVPQSNFNGTTNILILDLFTNAWQIHGQFNSTVDSGAFTLSGPSLSAGGTSGATPIPGALPLFASGGVLIGYLGLRRKRKVAALAA